MDVFKKNTNYKVPLSIKIDSKLISKESVAIICSTKIRWFDESITERIEKFTHVYYAVDKTKENQTNTDEEKS